MRNLLNRLDEIAQINPENPCAAWLERVAFVFLTLMALAAPHSIAATQTAWILGMLAWIIRLFLKPRPALVRTPLDVALWAFFGWSVVSSVFSYAPDISLDKLRGAALFLIFYFVVNVVRTRRAARFLALALIASCMFNVLLVPVERLVGRGVEIHGVRAGSPLAKALLYEGDTLLKANQTKIKTPEDLVAEIERRETTKVEFYRPDFYFAVEVKRADLLGGATASERLGIESWQRSRNWRSTGFYGHWTTYAEVLQLIAALVFGLLIASITEKRFSTRSRRAAEPAKSEGQSEGERESGKWKVENGKWKAGPNFPFSTFRFPFSVLLFAALAAMLFALLLNATRASQAGFLLAAAAIVVLSGSRKLIFALAAVALPLALVGSIYLQTSRNVGYVDEKDASTQYRRTMYRDGVRLWTESPRNFVFGVGMDSIKRYWREWNLFDGGNLPLGHFHSTPLQLAVERGLPALLLWLWILWIYGRAMRRAITNYKLQITNYEGGNSASAEENPKSEIQNPRSVDWREKGILMGCFGGMLGFTASGLVHYNLGDQEVAMIFFLLMGLGFALVNLTPIYRADNARA